MSKRYYVLGMLLFVCLLFVLPGTSPASAGGEPQETVKTDAPAAKKVSPAKPGVKPPVLHEGDGCQGCCCCCCEKDSGCKATHKKCHSKLHLGSQQGKTFTIEKCVGETGGHGAKEIKIIGGHPPGPKHKILHELSESDCAPIIKECLEQCGADCGADCEHKIIKTKGGACSSECSPSCASHYSSEKVCIAEARVVGDGSCGNVRTSRGHGGGLGSCGDVCATGGRMNVGMSSCTPSGARHCGPDCLLMCASVLGLTEDQQNELKDLQFAVKKKMIDLKADLQKAQLEMQEMMSADDLNATAIKRQLTAVAGAQTNVKFEMISTMIAAQKILTEEQRKLLKEKQHMLGGCCGGDAGMGMHLIETCRPQIIGEEKMIDVIVNTDKEGECIKVIEVEE